MKVLIALSGGVDSAVAAVLMLEAGHQVVSVTLLHLDGSPDRGAAPDAPGSVEDARRVADHLGIAHHVLDRRQAFRTAVVEPFAAAYRRGLTPNPCIECNRSLRFPALLAEASRLGCDLVATGHYARVRGDSEGWHLLGGIDRGKDQSYFLFMLGQEQLARLAFPLGEMRKPEVRRRARALGLPTADRSESQDLCFVGPGGYRRLLGEQFPEARRPGPIVDTTGREVGGHDGVAGFTIGQRRGLGVALGTAHYVVAVDPGTATVVVGRAAQLAARGCRVGGVSWVAGEPPAADGLEVKVRYRSPAVAARLEEAAEGEWWVRFASPVAAVAPGQASVFYRGDEVVGGGTILSTV